MRKKHVLIAGLGAMGSAAAFHLARRGHAVTGFDRFRPPHAMGSSHGETRIIREAYFEHPLYVPLIQRAYELWAGLERESGRTLLRATGGLMVGRPESEVVAGAIRSARRHGLRHEVLEAAEIRRRFPSQAPPDGFAGVWEPRAGALFPEACVAAHLERAGAAGARLRTEEPVVRWEAVAGGVRVHTPSGGVDGDFLLITAGAWAASLVADLALPLEVKRQVLHWFQPLATDGRFDPARCPVYIWEFEPGRYFYGFPDLGDGLKVAFHHGGERADPESIDRAVAPAEIEAMREVARRYLPGSAGAHLRSAVCMYTNTPDGHFLIDRHPAHDRVLIASPCSGHGFKFSSVIGEIAADLIEGRPGRFDLAPFRISGTAT